MPRYDEDKETETYTLNGEQLTPVAHRSELVDRNRTGDKQFYPRIEGSFNKVIRHGNSPAAYWWEVTDKSGTKYFYGGDPVSGADENASLSDDRGNKAHWCLKEVRDLDGNFVHYQYKKVEDKGVAGGTVPGYQIYIEKITYTGHGTEEGKYSVLFKRDRDLGENKRTDVSIAANLGFKQVTADLLRKIEVQFEDKNIRSYTLNYKKGAFYKTLLDSIGEFDAAGKFFNSHKFEYYDDVNAGGGYTPFTKSENWTPQLDGINASFINPIESNDPKKDFNDKASALSGTKSKDWGAGLSITIAPGLQNPFCKTLSVGGNFGYSESQSEGLLTMIDINGDGLVDKVFVKDNQISYRPNLGKSGEFDSRSHLIQGINTLYKEKSRTTNAGLEANAGCSAITAFVGKSWSWTTSTTLAYFTDVNGDQLPDLVKNGEVYFNHINPFSG